MTEGKGKKSQHGHKIRLKSRKNRRKMSERQREKKN